MSKFSLWLTYSTCKNTKRKPQQRKINVCQLHNTNKMLLILCLLSNFYLNMFRASLCPSSGEPDSITGYGVLHCNRTGENTRKMWAIESLCGVMRSKHSWDFVCNCVWSCVYVYGRVCMCMVLCLYVYGHVCMFMVMCVCVWPCVYVYGHVCMFMAVCVCVWTCVYVYGRVCMCMDMCVCVWTCVYVYGRVFDWYLILVDLSLFTLRPTMYGHKNL